MDKAEAVLLPLEELLLQSLAALPAEKRTVSGVQTHILMKSDIWTSYDSIHEHLQNLNRARYVGSEKYIFPSGGFSVRFWITSDGEEALDEAIRVRDTEESL